MVQRLAAQPPSAADVVVVGAGIVGCSAALFLAKRGYRVVLADKGPIGAEQSGRNWGWCRQLGRDRRELPLMRESLRQWQALQQQTEAGYRTTGILKVAASAAQIATWDAWAADAREAGIVVEMLSGAQAREKAPWIASELGGGIWVPGDGCAEPTLAAPAVADLARQAGATVLPHCAVRGFETSGGRLSRVVTERGAIEVDALLCAGGAWSSLFLRRHGVDLPQAGVRATAFRTAPMPALEGAQVVGSPDFALRRRADGGYTLGVSQRILADLSPEMLRWARTFQPMLRKEWGRIGFRAGPESWRRGQISLSSWELDGVSPFERVRTLNPAPDIAGADKALRLARQAIPALKEVPVAARWAGVIDGTPDALPVIDSIGQVPGLHVATGFSGHGFGIGPGAGRLAAELLAGDAPCVDPAPFRLERIINGPPTRIEVGL